MLAKDRDRPELIRFIADRMLGKLARELRILGYDTLFFREGEQKVLIRISEQEDRLILSRDRGLLMEKNRLGKRFFLITENDPKDQVFQVLCGLSLALKEDRFFTRCIKCNHLLKRTSKEEVEGRVADYIVQTHDLFSKCPGCDKIYWRGTHHQHMRMRIQGLLNKLNPQHIQIHSP